jgi:uncharacterized protein (DUF362 family)
MNDPALQVVLQKCRGYERSAITAAVDAALAHLGLAGRLHGQTVLLKPNLISTTGPQLACTHPQFLAGVAVYLRDCGARVLLGDSPAFGSAATVCHRQGIYQALKGLDVKIVDFSTPLARRLAGGLTVTLAREALECDLFVGLPKIKAHNQMYVTLAVKNLFGIVKGINKAMLHMVHGATHHRFAEIILDLVDLLPSQVHLADGIVAMHQSGPLDGRPLPLYCIAAAHSPVAMDTALLDVLELDPWRSPLWQVAKARNLVGCDLHTLCFPALSPQEFHGSGFLAPAGLNPIRFNPLSLLWGMMKRLALKVGS